MKARRGRRRRRRRRRETWPSSAWMTCCRSLRAPVSSELAERLGQAKVAQQQGQQLAKPGARPTTVMQLFGYDDFRGQLMRTLNDKDLVRRLLQAGLTELPRTTTPSA